MTKYSTFVSGLTEDTTPDIAADFVATYDASATAAKKVKLLKLGSAMVKLAEIVLGSPAANFDFTSIVGTYRNLKVFVQARSTTVATAQDFHLTLNADTGANYDIVLVNVVNTNVIGSNIIAGAQNYIGHMPAASAPANHAGLTEVTIFNYAGTTFFKSYSTTSGSHDSASAAGANYRSGTGQWRNTAAVTRVTLTPTANNFDTGSVATLYGLA